MNMAKKNYTFFFNKPFPTTKVPYLTLWDTQDGFFHSENKDRTWSVSKDLCDIFMDEYIY